MFRAPVTEYAHVGRTGREAAGRRFAGNCGIVNRPETSQPPAEDQNSARRLYPRRGHQWCPASRDRSDADGNVPETALVDVVPGTKVIVTAFDDQQSQSSVVSTI